MVRRVRRFVNFWLRRTSDAREAILHDSETLELSAEYFSLE